MVALHPIRATASLVLGLLLSTSCEALPASTASQQQEHEGELQERALPFAALPGVLGAGLAVLGVGCQAASAAGQPCPPQITNPFRGTTRKLERRGSEDIYSMIESIAAEVQQQVDRGELQKRVLPIAAIPGIASVALAGVGIGCQAARAAGNPCPEQITNPFRGSPLP
ncbi:hypothetical protein HK102_005810 [Quaeritorhiza haematococci]|nr:hypothetical protein HK102_005810 [Quaeritorhiza haematococci]